MLFLKFFNIISLPLCIFLTVVGHHTIAGHLVRVKLQKDEVQSVKICDQNTECVSSSEHCDVKSGLENLEKCGFIHELSTSFCCPIDKVIRSKIQKRMIDSDERSDLDIALDRMSPQPIKPMPEEPECGKNTKSLSNNKNVKNEQANDWPWMAVFLETINYQNFCGGTLINRRFVLTAAHCFKEFKKDGIVVRLGEYDFTTPNETNKNDFKVSDIRLHPDYDPTNNLNDIALVKLIRLTEYNSFVRPICLPKTNMDIYDKCVAVTGWGRTSYDGNLSNVLQEVVIPVWEHKKCVSAFTQTIFDTNICAASYEGGKDSCLGDSGGPLLIQRQDKRWTNIGVVSWGINCGQAGIPGVYIKVASYLKWIAVNTQDLL